jgi:Putative mono-oxygenase ydhR
MQIQIITYQLKDISQEGYLAQMVNPDAPILADVPGLIWKIWVAKPENNVYGGVYLWKDRASMETFGTSDMLKTIVARPYLFNIAVSDYEVREDPTQITRGPVFD